MLRDRSSRHLTRRFAPLVLLAAVCVLALLALIRQQLVATRYGSPRAAAEMVQPAALATLAPPDPATQVRVQEAYGKLPLAFEANQGQTAAEVQYLTRGRGYSLFLTPTEAILSLSKPAPKQQREAEHTHADGVRSRTLQPREARLEQAIVRMQLRGANPQPQISGVDELPGKTNYFFGIDPARWRTGVVNYRRVRYEEVYPGVDLIYYGNQQQLEYDFVVSAGADPKEIRLSFAGAEEMEIDARGELVLQTAGGEVRQHKPLIYQEVDGRREEIAGGYWLRGDGEVSFEIAEYDVNRALIIDPVLVYSTFLGGSSDESGLGIAVDSGGNTYITGRTISPDFPTKDPLQANFAGGFCFEGSICADIFITKLNAAGSALVYSTYLGGSHDDFGQGIAVDGAGNAYVTGSTRSSDFPTKDPLQANQGGGFCAEDNICPDAFITKLNAAGNAFVYSTYT